MSAFATALGWAVMVFGGIGVLGLVVFWAWHLVLSKLTYAEAYWKITNELYRQRQFRFQRKEAE